MNPTTPTTTLPLSAFRIGMRVMIACEHEYYNGATGEIRALYAEEATVRLYPDAQEDNGYRFSYSYQHLRPILRPLVSLTDEQLSEVATVAYPDSNITSAAKGVSLPGRSVIPTAYVFYQNGFKLAIRLSPFSVTLYTNGQDVADTMAIVRHLQENNYDVDGWIEKGLAVAEEQAQKQQQL